MFNIKIRPGIRYLIIVAIILLIIVYSPIFTLREIRISGLQLLTNDDIVRICNVPYGTPLFSLETDEISRRLLCDVRIEETVVRRSLPSTLDITITERIPIATVASNKHYFAIDKKGTIIDAYNEPKFSQLPNINGIYTENLFIGDKISDDNTKNILLYLETLNPKYLPELKEFNCQNNTIMCETLNGVTIRLGNLSNIETKVKLTENFLEDFKQNQISAEYVDFKYDAPFMKMKEENENENS